MATHLKAGDKAPAFKGKDQNGNTISLTDFKGKKLAVFFYPEDDTPTCTVQACSLRDGFGELSNAGITVIGISPDSSASHKKFEEKFNLPFPLIADEKHAIIDTYGVWGEKNMYGNKFLGLHRTTFLIDEKGKIIKVILKPKNKDHAQEIVKHFKAIETAGN